MNKEIKTLNSLLENYSLKIEEEMAVESGISALQYRDRLKKTTITKQIRL